MIFRNTLTRRTMTFRSPVRRRRLGRHRHCHQDYEKVGTTLFLLLVITLSFLLYLSQGLLDNLLADSKWREFPAWGASGAAQASLLSVATTAGDTFRKEVPPKNRGFLVFFKMGDQQGMGNIMSGLLAAHLLGTEFDRHVCIASDFDEFHWAFESNDATTAEACSNLFKEELLPSVDEGNLVRLVNYEPEPDECQLQQKLQSKNLRVIFMTGNTYPRWPAIHQGFFERWYRPKSDLLNLLPYSTAPPIVVHLRQPDRVRDDRRPGLDPPALEALGQLLPANQTYLVTNRVEWFDYFEVKYGWRHGPWNEVIHSGYDGKSWGVRFERFWSDTFVNANDRDRKRQIMQLWVDWYTLLQAQLIYHTHSDFSLSAIRWMNISSWRLGDFDPYKQQLQLEVEYFRQEGTAAPLVDRSASNSNPARALRNCAS